MASFFSHINKVLKKVIGGIGHLFSKENIAKAEQIAGRVTDLAAIAMPYVERFATLTSTTADDEFIAAAGKMNKTLDEILDEPDEDKRRGLVLGLIGHATREKVASLVDGSAGHKIKIGDISVRVPDDVGNIAGNLFDAAVQLAFSLFVKPSLPKVADTQPLELPGS